jgi:hypothetical protein
MLTMASEPTSAYVWIWLPGANDPVVCGRLDHVGSLDNQIAFVYAAELTTVERDRFRQRQFLNPHAFET